MRSGSVRHWVAGMVHGCAVLLLISCQQASPTALPPGGEFNFSTLLQPSARQEQAWADSAWRDASPHQAKFVQAGRLRLHYLDWGGTGPALVLLPGMSHTAHQFDDLAPALTTRFHVLALTLRGHGRSDHPAGAYTVDSLSRDVALALDALRLPGVILAGHSLGGHVSNRVARQYPQKLQWVVYLDATKDSTGLRAVRAAAPFQRPDQRRYAWNSLTETRRSYRALFFRFWSDAQEADFREQNTAPQIAGMRDLYYPLVYSPIRVPQLALCALDREDLHFPWLSDHQRLIGAQAIRDYHTRHYLPWEQAGCSRFSEEATNGREVVVPASHHYIHLVNRDVVIRELLALASQAGKN
jgi:pimeloyl-ACP methyl ester carboxylesterase